MKGERGGCWEPWRRGGKRGPLVSDNVPLSGVAVAGLTTYDNFAFRSLLMLREYVMKS
jgi:hypothetical protein